MIRVVMGDARSLDYGSNGEGSGLNASRRLFFSFPERAQ